jgi:tRNA dimethylallyltransferase
MQAYFLAGPTASGKTAVAHQLALHNGYEILSADSMLIYRGMDIGTAKPTARERAQVRYFGIDLVPPHESFNAWHFHRHACEALADIERRGKQAVVVGGTGLYLKLLTHGLSDVPGPDPEVRGRWKTVLARDGATPLAAALRTQSPSLYDAIDDPCNGRRLIRFLEWAAAGLTTPPRGWQARGAGAPMAALAVAPTLLKSRIEQRVRAMYGQGLLGEVRALLAAEVSLSPTAQQAIGYAEAIDLIAGRCDEASAIERTAARTRRLAKRQRSWLRTQAEAVWIDAGAARSRDEIAADVQAHWEASGPTAIAG